MFENVSQGLVYFGAVGHCVAIALRILATVFMTVSLYTLLKARNDKHKIKWLIAVWFAPIATRIGFEVYCLWIDKKEVGRVKGSMPFLIASVVTYVIAAVLLGMSVASIGVGFVKSEIDGEPLSTFYDVHGNAYHNIFDIPLYDKEGNTYTHKAEFFSAGTFIDQNGRSYDGEYCYLSEDGYFYFDERDELEPYQESLDYYTDGETIYYYLFNQVYWQEDGTMFELSGRLHLELFDFDE